MELKSRQTYILRSLLEADQGISSALLLTQLDIARRTLYYDVEKINDWLSYHSMGRVIVSGQNLRAEVFDQDALDRQLKRTSSYFFSVAERRAMGILYISLSSRSVTISSLMDYFEISKNTALADIKTIRDELEGWGLALHSAIKLGYHIAGEEAVIRKLIWTQFRKLNNPEGTASVKSFLQQSMVALTGNDVDFLELCRCLIKQYESDIKGDCFLDVSGFESMMIQASWIRSRKGREINMSDDEQFALMKTLSYRSVEFSAQKLGILGMGISPMETYYITSLFLGIQTTGFTSQEEENSYIAILAEQLIYHFERIACISFPNRERLHGQLTHHIRPMYYRLKYGILAKNPLAKDIMRMYPVIYNFTRRAMQEIDTRLHTDISEDELAYLCVYFASNLSEKAVSQGDCGGADEVLIIGPENMATATLVKEQLQDLFGLSFRYSVITVDRLRKWALEDYALVVSLIPLGKQLECGRQVHTGPILTEADQRKILDVLRQNRTVARHDSLIRDIIRLAETDTEGRLQSEKLYFDLFRYFEQRGGGKTGQRTTATFLELVCRENVVAVPDGIGWNDAVLRGAASLQREGNSRLTAKMRNLLYHKKTQMYRICPDAVLVHCPMQGEVDAQLAVRMVLSRAGVACRDGQRARVLLCLSTVDWYTHWNILQEIYQYFSAQGHVDGVLEMYDEKGRPADETGKRTGGGAGQGPAQGGGAHKAQPAAGVQAGPGSGGGGRPA